MKHYLRDLFLAGLALLALSSCHSADPEKEAEKLNEQFTELINSIDTNASPYTRYKYLLKIKDTADSLFSKGRTGFKKKKLALYRQNVIEIYCCPLKVSEQRDIHPQCCCNGIADDFSEGKPLS